MCDNVKDPETSAPSVQEQFLQLVQKPTETFDDFLTKLVDLAKLGQFEEMTENMILGKIKLDVADKDLKRKLESVVDYKKVLELCRKADHLQRASKDPEIVRYRKDIFNSGVSKIQLQEYFAHFMQLVAKIRFEKWTSHPRILKSFETLLLDINSKMKETITVESAIFPIGSLVLSCSHCDIRIAPKDVHKLANPAIEISENDLASTQSSFEDAAKNLPKALGFLCLLKSRLHGALIQLIMTCETHQGHSENVDFAITDKLYCGICLDYKATFGHFKNHWQLMANPDSEHQSEPKKPFGNRNRFKKNRRDWEKQPQNELEALLDEGSRNKPRPAYQRPFHRGDSRNKNWGNKHYNNKFSSEDYKDLLAGPDSSVKYQHEFFSKLQDEKTYEKVKGDLLETFKANYPDTEVVFYGSRVYELGNKLDMMVMPFGKDSVDLTANSAEVLRSILAKKPDIWLLEKPGKSVYFSHKKSGNKCKIMPGKPDDIFIHNTKMIGYLMKLQPEMRKMAMFLSKWFQRAKILYYLKTYSLTLMIISYAQNQKMMPSMLQLKEKSLEMMMDRESFENDAEWLNSFKFDLTLKDLELVEMDDYKIHLKDFFKFFLDNSLDGYAFLPYSGQVIKKSELVNYVVDGEAIFAGYELTGLFIGGLLDYTNNTTHDLWLKDYESVKRLIVMSEKKMDELNLSEILEVAKNEVLDEAMETEEASDTPNPPEEDQAKVVVEESDETAPVEKSVETISVEETEEIPPVGENVEISSVDVVEDSLEVSTADEESISSADLDTESAGSNSSHSGSFSSEDSNQAQLSHDVPASPPNVPASPPKDNTEINDIEMIPKVEDADFDKILSDMQKQMVDPTLIPDVVVTPPRDPPKE